VPSDNEMAIDQEMEDMAKFVETSDFSLDKDRDLMKRHLERNHISSMHIEMTELSSFYHLERVKVSLMLKFPRLMSDLVQVLLDKKEIDLACYMTAFYKI
jgi:hypothetical protein